MKPISLLLLVLLTVSQAVDAQGVVRRSKPSGTKTSRPVQSAKCRRAATASYSDGVLRVGDVSYRMVRVEAGTFTMGATPEQRNPWDDEKPTHRVTLSADYFLGVSEVTQALWCAVMGESLSQRNARKGRQLYGVGDDYPMYDVDWDDCQEFLRRLNELTGLHFRLPTEAEWEYAARGGNFGRGYQYAGADNIDAVAWYADNSGNTSHPVMAKQPNELGLYDMCGNVYEWCQDWYGRYDSISQTNPTGPVSASRRVFRGGCWTVHARFCRVAYRSITGNFYGSLGLRLALSE